MTMCPLTSKEIEVVKWLSLGKTAGETATIMGLSVNTTQTHIAHAKAKTNSATATSLVAAALRADWIQ